MTQAATLIDDLSRSGVTLSRNGDKLVLDGPEAVIDDALVERVRPLKADIIALLADPEPEWSTDDWQALFHERAGIAEFDGGQTRADAEAQAFEHCVVEWRNRNPQASEPGRCALCGDLEDEESVVVPFGTDSHTWLHHGCWADWFATRRLKAAEALSGFGITYV